jgi:hypothetical protein
MQHQLFFPALSLIVRESFMTSILFNFRLDVKREISPTAFNDNIRISYICSKLGGYFSDIVNVGAVLVFLETKLLYTGVHSLLYADVTHYIRYSLYAMLYT